MYTKKETLKAFGVECYYDEAWARVYNESRNKKTKYYDYFI